MAGEKTREELLQEVGMLRSQLARREAFERGTEEGLARAEPDFSTAVLDTAGALVIVLDAQGQIVRFNQACEQTSGRSFEEVRGKYVWDLFLLPEEIEPVKEVFSELKSGHFPSQHENYWLTSDGRRRLIAWSNTALMDDQGHVNYVVGTGLDITERRDAEQALKASERNYREIFNAANDIIAVHDALDGNIVDVNSKWCEVYGYAAEEATGLNVADFSLGQAPFTQEDAIGWVRKAAEEGPQLFEWLCKKRSGKLFWVEVNLKKAVISDRQRILAVVRDITERKQAAKELREAYDELEQRVQQRTVDLARANEALTKEVDDRKKAEAAVHRSRAFLQTVIDAMPEVMLVIDRDYRVLLANRAGLETAGQDSLASGCLTCHQISHRQELPCQGAEAPCPLKEVVATKRPAILTHTHSNAEGNPNFVEVRAAPIFDEAGEVIQIIESCRDITDRIRAEEALRESEQRFRALVEATSDWIWEVDQNGLYIYASPKVEDLLGYRPEQVIGKSPLDLVVPDEVERLAETFRQAAAAPEPFLLVEKTTLHKDQRKVVLETSGVPILDEHGNLCGYRGVDRDITEPKEAQAELQRIMAKLQRSNRDLAQFAYSASHDLQEPLRMMMSYLQALGEHAGERLDERSRDFLGLSSDAVERMQRLINDLLSYAHVGTREKHSELVDVNSIVDQVIADLGVAIEQSGAQVTHGRLPAIVSDATLITQLLQNLIGNAVKFRGDKPPRVHVWAEPSGNEWVFSVQDNGIGIDSQYAERIFSVFERLHPSDTYPGSGIGLAICKRVVERHDGRIWCDSEPGKGATFRFSIPMEQKDQS